ncbi:MAG: DNA polymerase IV [Deltaproteobacteria bacterium]|nr:DNA polymerase IV [Deltaproteobacteria bacterium]
MQRRILHLDMDAFYAAIEQRDFPELRGKPLIVGGNSQRGVVATASYEARPYGVRSAMPMMQALKLCPQAIVVPPRRDHYLAVSRQIFAILRAFTPLVEPISLDEAFLDVTASEQLFGTARAIAERIKARIHAETQLTASAGIAPNKFVAKIASDMRKPDGLLEILPPDILTFLHPLPVTKIWGVGRVTAQTLHGMGVHTIGDLARFSREALVARFGVHGEQLFNLSHGLDERLVDPNQEVKSLGEEETFLHDLMRDQDVHPFLLRQSQTVAQRLRTRHLVGATITVKIKLAERLGEGRFRLYTRSHTLPSPTNDAQEIYRTALALYDSVPRRRVGVRLAGVYASSLEPEGKNAQLDLFVLAPQQTDKRHQLGHLLDQLTSRYGEGIVQWGETRTTASTRSRDPGSFRKEEVHDPLTREKKGR